MISKEIEFHFSFFRFTVNEITGTMTINPVQESDHAEYKCVASNAAAKVERIIKISVISKPKITPVKNVTVLVNKDAVLECLARGRPRPQISFRYFLWFRFRISTRKSLFKSFTLNLTKLFFWQEIWIKLRYARRKTIVRSKNHSFQ